MDIREELKEIQEKIDILTEKMTWAEMHYQYDEASKFWGERAELIRKATELSKDLEIWEK